jgi:hypothetical protein
MNKRFFEIHKQKEDQIIFLFNYWDFVVYERLNFPKRQDTLYNFRNDRSSLNSHKLHLLFKI